MKRTILVGALMLGTSLCSQSFGFDLLDRMLGLQGSGCDSSCCDTGVACHEPACGLEQGCCPSTGPACGCEQPACCEPACGAEGGLLGRLHRGGPACGCENVCQPACGAEVGCCDGQGGLLHRRGGLLARLFGHHNQGCDACCEQPVCCEQPACCEPACGVEGGLLGRLHHGGAACGCENVCQPACGAEVGCCDSIGGGIGRGGLLARLFGHHRNACCDSACDSAAACGCTGGAIAPAPAGQPQAAPVPPAPAVDPSAYLQSKRRVIQASSYVR